MTPTCTAQETDHDRLAFIDYEAQVRDVLKHIFCRLVNGWHVLAEANGHNVTVDIIVHKNGVVGTLVVLQINELRNNERTI